MVGLSRSRWWFERFFIFTRILGDMIQFDEDIFQVGWFNHQLVVYCQFIGFIHYKSGESKADITGDVCGMLQQNDNIYQ